MRCGTGNLRAKGQAHYGIRNPAVSRCSCCIALSRLFCAPAFPLPGYGRLAIAKALLAAGAELNPENDAKQTPVDVAKMNGEVSCGESGRGGRAGIGDRGSGGGPGAAMSHVAGGMV